MRFSPPRPARPAFRPLPRVRRLRALRVGSIPALRGDEFMHRSGERFQIHSKTFWTEGRGLRTESLEPTRSVLSPQSSALVEPLSARELQVLRLLKTELSGPEIAQELVVALSTVRTYTKSIYSKLNVTNRRAAVKRAAELGLI